MSRERKIVVPEGMMNAFSEAYQARFGHVPGGCKVGLEAALGWLSENPLCPTVEQADEIRRELHPESKPGWITFSTGDCEPFAEKWQRRMFLAPPEPESKEIKDLLLELAAESEYSRVSIHPDEFNRRVREAFRRGQRAQEKR